MEYKLDHIKFTREAAWLMPFVNAAKDLVPIDKLKKVRVYKTPMNKQEDTEGLITCNSAKNYVISICVAKHEFTIKSTDPLVLVHKRRPQRHLWHILSALAHELSHLTYWEHDTDHYMLENRIMRRFVKVLKQKYINDLYKRGAV
jgi:hypothetical protein